MSSQRQATKDIKALSEALATTAFERQLVAERRLLLLQRGDWSAPALARCDPFAADRLQEGAVSLHRFIREGSHPGSQQQPRRQLFLRSLVGCMGVQPCQRAAAARHADAHGWVHLSGVCKAQDTGLCCDTGIIACIAYLPHIWFLRMTHPPVFIFSFALSVLPGRPRLLSVGLSR